MTVYVLYEGELNIEFVLKMGYLLSHLTMMIINLWKSEGVEKHAMQQNIAYTSYSAV